MKILSLLILLNTILLNAQSGVIKGRIVDAQSEVALSGVSVELLDQDPPKGVITDQDGFYIIEDVPLGRQTIRVKYLGYETKTYPNIKVTAGKEAIVNVKLQESFQQLDEVIITSETRKDEPINQLATVSARQFSMEEVQRFSGGRSDIGRLAANFAGVSVPDDSRNDIIVRGNSPTSVLYRLEGIPIPDPNHFSSIGTTGGAVSAVNPNLLKNSDFITSAFPSEYGNATGAVFDLGFREGNKDNYEYTAQLGSFSGLEALAEGPLGQKDGSFLISGRYSLVGLLGLGGGTTQAVPDYSDISMNLDFGKSKYGDISMFGIYGTSNIEFIGDEISEDDLFAAKDEDLFVNSSFGVLGLKHRFNISNSTYIKNIVSFSFSGDEATTNRYFNVDQPNEDEILYSESDNFQNRFSFSTLINSKINRNTTVRAGLLFEQFNVQSLLRDRERQSDNNNDGYPDLFTFRDIDENLNIIQPHVHAKYRILENLTINGGIHSQYSSLNEQIVIEPRMGIDYELNDQHSFNFGFGVHHQPVPLPILFLNEEINGELVATNKDLDFVRSDHYVLGYDLNIDTRWRAKLEVYYQDISNAGVDPFPSSYSTLTEGSDFTFDNNSVSLVSEGTGYNQGIELTVEKFYSNGYYGLFTASIYESKYKGSDDIERNSPFNNGYIFNFLAGKEFKTGKNDQDVFFIDSRVSFAGGRYYTPIDLAASQDAGFEIRNQDEAYSKKFDDYFRWDFKLGYRLNNEKKNQSHEFYVDFLNLTDNENVFTRRYNRLNNEVNQINQLGFFPDFGYRFQF